LLEEVVFYQVWRERDLAHMEFSAMLFCVFHALGFKGVLGLTAWAKRVPIKCWERELQKEGMEFGEEEVVLGRLEEELVVGILGGWDSTC